MARKKTYIYHMLIGDSKKISEDFFMLARNKDCAVEFCKEKFRDKKYCYYQAIKVGVSHTLQDTQIIDEYEAEQLRNAGADKSDFYSEQF